MDKEKQLEIDYFRKKRLYEEQEDDLLAKKNKGLQDIEEVAEMSRYYLKDFVEDKTELLEGMRMLDNLKEEVEYASKKERMQIENALEDLESERFRQLRNATENK